ncbi:hypothetical protein [Streptomyces sp. NPDC088358]|uniref:hypothetical protein n=1 Tax=Streptomyces sp. NPDC088358 TaxID=3365857 RepID=UPI0037F35775
MTRSPGLTERGTTWAPGSADAAEAVAPSAVQARAVADSTRAVRRIGWAPSEGLRLKGHGRRAP